MSARGQDLLADADQLEAQVCVQRRALQAEVDVATRPHAADGTGALDAGNGFEQGDRVG